MKFILALVLIISGTLTTFASNHSQSVLRISTTLQSYNPSQPWDKSAPKSRRALATVLHDGLVLTTAEMVTNANFIQLETTDGDHQIPAQVHTIDYESNLALLEAITPIGKELIASLTPLEISSSAKINDTIEIVQILNNGTELVTEGRIQGVDVVAGFASGHYFLNYEVKASLQSAANSFTLPVLREGKFLGILTSYSSKDQVADLITPEIIKAFIKDARTGDYVGFPMLGVSTSSTNDPNFREWLKLPEGMGGIYITRILPNSAAAEAKLEKGDVITAIDGYKIDKRGNYKDPQYGTLFWSHLIRGTKPVGKSVQFDVQREGKSITIDARLSRAPEGIIPSHTYGKSPRYLVKGGLVFQELTKSYLEAFGKDWQSRAPLNLLDALNHPEDYEEGRNRIVFISATIPTPATLGYESLRSVIVKEVNGMPIEDIPGLIEAFKQEPQDGSHSLVIDNQPDKIYLDANLTRKVDQQLLQRGLPSLFRETD